MEDLFTIAGTAPADKNPGKVLDYRTDECRPLIGLSGLTGQEAITMVVLKAGRVGDVAAYRGAILDIPDNPEDMERLAHNVAAHGQKLTERESEQYFCIKIYGHYRN